MRCEFCNKRIWWFNDQEFLGLETIEEYILPDNKTKALYRHKNAHTDCIRKYGKRIDK